MLITRFYKGYLGFSPKWNTSSLASFPAALAREHSQKSTELPKYSCIASSPLLVYFLFFQTLGLTEKVCYCAPKSVSVFYVQLAANSLFSLLYLKKFFATKKQKNALILELAINLWYTVISS